MSDFLHAHAQLCQLVKLGHFDAVVTLINRFRGTGAFPQRLALLEESDELGRRPEDLAELQAESSPPLARIHQHLRSERMRMAFFE